MLCPVCLSDCWSSETDTLQPDYDFFIQNVKLDAASCNINTSELLYKLISNYAN